jgi:hypothetical protein
VEEGLVDREGDRVEDWVTRGEEVEVTQALAVESRAPPPPPLLPLTEALPLGLGDEEEEREARAEGVILLVFDTRGELDEVAEKEAERLSAGDEDNEESVDKEGREEGVLSRGPRLIECTMLTVPGEGERVAAAPEIEGVKVGLTERVPCSKNVVGEADH